MDDLKTAIDLTYQALETLDSSLVSFGSEEERDKEKERLTTQYLNLIKTITRYV